MALLRLFTDLLIYVISWWKLFIVVALVIFAIVVFRRYNHRFNYFQLDRSLGLSSDSFNLDDNIESGDQRAGLDLWSKLSIRWLMFRHRVSFDEARELHVQNAFTLNDINPDGTPRDPKAIFFGF